MDRRTFINRWVRAGVLASMALVTGVLVSRRQVSMQQDCGLEFQCRDCRKLSSCTLPEAEEEREKKYEKG